MVSIARLSVVKQSSFGLPGQYGRRVTRVNKVGKHLLSMKRVVARKSKIRVQIETKVQLKGLIFIFIILYIILGSKDLEITRSLILWFHLHEIIEYCAMKKRKKIARRKDKIISKMFFVCEHKILTK